MARRVEIHSNLVDGRLNLTSERRKRLEDWLMIEVHDAFSARKNLDHNWRVSLSDYEGIPEYQYMNVPVEGFKNLIVTIGAIAADTIYANAIELMTGVSPLINVRGVPKQRADEETSKTAKAFQRFVDWGTVNEWGTYDALDDMTLDTVQLGTSCLYSIFQQRRKKTRVAKILSSSPYTYCIPPEDIIVPGGTKSNPRFLRWIGLRNWYSPEEFNEMAAANNWNISGAQPVAATDWVRQRREALGRQMEGIVMKGKVFDVISIYALYDIDGDGMNEDLLIQYNYSGQKVLKAEYNPCDDVPISTARYQKRGHLFWGMGVLEMIRPFQEELSSIHNWRNLNMFLANCRLWKTRYGNVPETMTLWGGKVLQMQDPEQFVGEQMADVYPSSFQAELMTGKLAEQRVGMSEMLQPKVSQMMGSRTPGITAMTMMNQAHRRFVPAYNSMKACVANSAKQCCYRYKEMIAAGDASVETHIVDVLGVEDGQRVIRVLRSEQFEEAVQLELTASSPLVNKEADKQNSLLLVNILIQYYERVMQLAVISANPQVPPEIKSVAGKIAKGSYEVMDRTIRTFDQVRDPALFLVDISEQLDMLEAGTPDQRGQIMQMLAGAGLVEGEPAQGGQEMMPTFMQGGEG